MVRVLSLFALFALCGCSSMLELPHTAAIDANETPEIYYRQLVANAGLAQQFTKADPYAQVQISGVHRSIPPQPGDWMTCLTATVRGQQKYMAVFIRNRAVTESRSGISIDRCDLEQYGALPVVAAVPDPYEDRDMMRSAAPSAPPLLPSIY